MSDTIASRKWRADHEKAHRGGVLLEEIADRLGIQDLFEIRANWGPLALDWAEHGETLASFTSRVERASRLLDRPPDEVQAKHWNGQFSADRAPDLIARWTLEDESDEFKTIDVFVRAFSPTECKVDPRGNYQERKEQAIHPECAAVLSSLEDLDLGRPDDTMKDPTPTEEQR